MTVMNKLIQQSEEIEQTVDEEMIRLSEMSDFANTQELGDDDCFDSQETEYTGASVGSFAGCV
eukprot:SAG11_NODE_26649_length_342_cov_1.279835_1_plen_63_part_00